MKRKFSIRTAFAAAMLALVVAILLTACGGGGGGGGGGSASCISFTDTKLAAWMDKIADGYTADYEYNNGTTKFSAHVVTDRDKIYAEIEYNGETAAQLNDGTSQYVFDPSTKTYTKATADKVEDTSLDGLPTVDEIKSITSIVEGQTTKDGVQYDSETITFTSNGKTATAEYLYDSNGELKYATLKSGKTVVELHYVCITIKVDLSALNVNTYIDEGYTLTDGKQEPVYDPDKIIDISTDDDTTAADEDGISGLPSK